MRQHWLWMRKGVSFASVDGQAEYTTSECRIPAGTFGNLGLTF